MSKKPKLCNGCLAQDEIYDIMEKYGFHYYTCGVGEAADYLCENKREDEIFCCELIAKWEQKQKKIKS